MSAIWGIVSRNNINYSEKFEKMTSKMKEFKIDRIDTLILDNAYMGCGHQYFTKEAEKDVSPILDKESKLLFAADCFLYNREDLLKELGLTDTTVGDAELSYKAFKKFGLDFVSKLRGSFSFAIFDGKENKLHLFTDHFCKRYLAYTVTDKAVIFGTNYKPILAGADNKLKINKRTVVNAYSTLSPLNFVESENTTFEGVYHLDAAKHYTIDIKTGAITKEQYWKPRENVKKLKGLKDEDYKKLFLKTYEKVCVAHLRSRKETGIMLSGGLDSSSVLAMVAPTLKKQNKNIYSYTSVPSSTFKAKINYSVIEDESFLIKEQQKFHDNLVPRYIGGEEDNTMDFLDKYQNIYDIPVKAAINNYNIVKMSEAAIADNCSILLGGSNGNASVSYGYTSTYIGLCISKGKFISAIKEASAYCEKCHISKKGLLKDFLKDLYGYYIKPQNVGQTFLSSENRKKYDTNKLMSQNTRNLGSVYHVTERQKRNYMFIPMQYIQKSLYYTCLSLELGYLMLDPTLTVEIVELCLSLPDECFVHNGIERRLIRDYMKELLPPWITDMRKGYGVQASDYNHRINRDWDRIRDQVMDWLNEPMLYEYFDRKELDELKEKVEKNQKNFDWMTAWYLVNTCALATFLRGHKEYL